MGRKDRNVTATFMACSREHNNSDDKNEKWIRWHPSREDCLVVNVDGSSLGNPGRAGFGRLLRNSSRAWISGFGGFIGHSDNLHAELLAIYHGLSQAWERGYKDIICYSDSTHAISLVLGPTLEFHRCATIVQDIKNLLLLQWNVRLLHTLREGNHCADCLAKMGASSDEPFTIYDDPPPSLRQFIAADAAGVEFLRN